MADARLLFTALCLVAAMLIAAYLGLRHWLGIAILVLLCLAWVTVDQAWEGDIVFTISRSHGVTGADFVALAGFVLAAALAVRLRLRTRSRSANRISRGR